MLHVDLLILGGGINGTGIARDAAGRGLSVLVCETRDLASGTSANSSKLIHGGLRYLEYGELRLVHEALAEREILLQLAPHIIQALDFTLPWDRHLRPRWLIRLGLFLYDHLARRQQLARSKSLRFKPSPHNPLKPQFTHGFRYSDCSVDDARLVILNALSAAELGAHILTRTTCIKIERFKTYWHATLQKSDQSLLQIHAKCVINATGPWVDQTHHALFTNPSLHHLQKIKGSHLIVPKFYQGTHAYILQHTDQRIVFVIPFNNDTFDDTLLIGTTDIAFDGDPTTAQCSPAEAEYLCAVVNHYFQHTLSPDQALWSYSGVRGLVAVTGKSAQALSRDYALEINSDAAPLLTVFGGKITTYRPLAEQALSLLAPYLAGRKKAWTATIPLPGGDLKGLTWQVFLMQCRENYAFLPEKMCYRLAHAYGSRITSILGTTANLDQLGPCFGADLYRAEVDYLYHHEWAYSADDILWRRTKLGLQFTTAQTVQLTDYLTSLCKLPK